MATLTPEGSKRVHTHMVWTTHPDHHTLIHICRDTNRSGTRTGPSRLGYTRLLHARVCVLP